MKKTLLRTAVLCGLVGLGLAGSALANGALPAGDPAMMASPHVIVLAKVSILTVHTNIPADAVAVDSVELNGVAALSTGVDNCGHLVAKFVIADLALTPGTVTLTLSGLYDDGTAFVATEAVTVK